MKVTVTKYTDDLLIRKACSKTFNGDSKQSLLSAYKSEHSPSRTQMFWIECDNIPLYVSTHLLRHHVGMQPYALTHRIDRDGGGYDLSALNNEVNSLQKKLLISEKEVDKAHISNKISEKLKFISENCGRNAPTDLGMWANAQSLIDMAKYRACLMASLDTRNVFSAIKREIKAIDNDLADMLVKKCVYRNGICGEPTPCGYNKSNTFKEEISVYLSCFSDKQKPMFNKEKEINLK